MTIVKPYAEVPEINGVELMKNIEKAGRTCYKSEVQSEDSYKRFINSIISRGHESVLEHEKVTVRFVADRGTMWDITRHRHASFSIESSRWCNYGKEGFGKEIKIIEPFFLVNDKEKYSIWENAMKAAEEAYMKLIDMGCPPDYARMTVPASLATEIVMTANIREWRHIFNLRCAKPVHPHVKQVMIALLLHFKKVMPELFEDIPYDEEFYAQYKDELAKINVI